MAYQKDFLQLTWGGPYFIDDIWINGLHIIADSIVEADTVAQAFNLPALEDFAATIQAVHTGSDGNASQAKLSWVKLARIGRDGKYTSDPIVIDLADISGGRISQMYPQLATAVTLRGEKRRGPAAYGRYYAPLAMLVDGNGKATTASITAVVNKQQAFLTNLNGDLANNTVGNFIKLGNVSKVGNGAQEVITSVFVGDLVDTQRRRRNKLNETYTGVTI